MSATEHPTTPLRDDDPLWDALANQPAPDVEPWRRENIRLQARAHLGVEAPGVVRPLSQIYARFLEPAWVSVVSGGWLVWTVHRVLTLHGG